MMWYNDKNETCAHNLCCSNYYYDEENKKKTKICITYKKKNGK